MKKVVIVGGGIAGMTAGVLLQKAGFTTEIYEKMHYLADSVPDGRENHTLLIIAFIGSLEQDRAVLCTSSGKRLVHWEILWKYTKKKCFFHRS